MNATQKEISSVKLDMKEYYFKTDPRPLKVHWTCLPELNLMMTPSMEKDFVKSVAWDFIRSLYKDYLDKFLKIFELQEEHRIKKMGLFLYQTDEMYRIRQVRVDSFRAAYC